MKSLVVQIQSELSDLAKYWSTKLKLHKSVYESSLLLPPLREPPPNQQVVGPVPVVVVAPTPKIVHKSTASSVQPKKSVIFDKVYDYPFGPERAKQQQAKTTNLEGSQSPDSETVESILKFACDHHHCSSCNDFDAMKYETKQPRSLNGNGKRLSSATSSSARANGSQTDTAKKMSKFTATTIPSTALATSNQTDQDNSFVQRSRKRTFQTLMDQSIEPGSSSSAGPSSSSLYHQPAKRFRTSNHEPLLSQLMALVSAIPPMNDYQDIECLKSLLRTVRKVIGNLKGASMLEDGELQLELMQMFLNKLHERVRSRFFDRSEFRRNPVRATKVWRLQNFLKIR